MNPKINIGFLLFFSTAINAASEEQMILESKQSIKQYATQLKAKLQEGMKAGGPANAIQVCNTAAEEISRQVSAKQGWKITRTSLKVRNSNNKPDVWETKVLHDFEQRMKQGEAIEKLEFSEIIRKDSQPVFRYMKAIPTQGICLSCHGDKLSPDVTEKLRELYPEDQATGFKMGDIRGAFSITRHTD